MDNLEKEQKIVEQIKQYFKSGDEISIPLIQRRFTIGYNAAWRIMDCLLTDKFVIKNENKIGISKVS
jgi:DNA segregation ATPase FtsK/SpoIIIE-like protein